MSSVFTVKQALLIEQDDLEEVWDPNDVQFDSPQDNDDGLELDEDEHFLGVVRCILTKPTSEDWRSTANFTTYMKCGQAFYRVIIDSISAINAVSSKPVSQLKLTPQAHPSPYKVSWVNKTSLPVGSSFLQGQYLVRRYSRGCWSHYSRSSLAL